MNEEENIDVKPFIEVEDRKDDLVALSHERSKVISNKINDLIELNTKKVREPTDGKKDGKDGAKDGKDDQKGKDGEKGKDGSDGGGKGGGVGGGSDGGGADGGSGGGEPRPKTGGSGHPPPAELQTAEGILVLGKDPKNLDFKSMENIAKLSKKRANLFRDDADKPIM